MNRPIEIAWFERIIIASLALGALNSWLAWPQLLALGSPGFLISVQLFTFAVMLGLALLISRRRSNVAKWINIALAVVGFPFWLAQLLTGTLPGVPAISVLQCAAQL